MSLSLSDRFAAGEALLSGWVTLPEPLVAEAVARAGFPAVTLDMQHGLVDLASAFRQIAGVRHAGSRAVVRIPIGEFQNASRLADAGADAVIAPMIDSVAEAKAFASHLKYPPLGQRSFGPGRAVQLAAYEGTEGATRDGYLRIANRQTLAIVMIETRRALAAVDEILALPEVDGVFVGPGDLSIALSDRSVLDIESPENLVALEHVARRSVAAGKPAGIFAATGGHAKRYLAMGYRLVTLMTDVGYIAAGAKAAMDEAR